MQSLVPFVFSSLSDRVHCRGAASPRSAGAVPALSAWLHCWQHRAWHCSSEGLGDHRAGLGREGLLSLHDGQEPFF